MVRSTTLPARYLTFWEITGLSRRARCLSFVSDESGSRAGRSAIRLCERLRVIRFGMDREIEGWIVEMRLRARRRVLSFGLRGKLPSVATSLSVRSMHSWS